MVYWIEETIETIVSMLESNLWFVPLLAFVAGLLTSNALLPHQPSHGDKLYKRHQEFDKRRLWPFPAFRSGHGCSVHYAGSICIFVGRTAPSFGCLVVSSLAAVTVLMALQMFEIIDIIPRSLAHSKSAKKVMRELLPRECLAGSLLPTARCLRW